MDTAAGGRIGLQIQRACPAAALLTQQNLACGQITAGHCQRNRIAQPAIRKRKFCLLPQNDAAVRTDKKAVYRDLAARRSGCDVEIQRSVKTADCAAQRRIEAGDDRPDRRGLCTAHQFVHRWQHRLRQRGACKLRIAARR